MKQKFVNATIADKRKGKEASANAILARTDRDLASSWELKAPEVHIVSEPKQVGVIVGKRNKSKHIDNGAEAADVKGALGKAMRENNVKDVLAYFKLNSLP